MSKTVKLAIYFNDELRAVKELAIPLVIGRSHDANLTIPHPMVSRRHCLIFQKGGTFCLQDLGSLNGIYSGQERIKDMELRDGTEFLIGTIRFVFNPADAMEYPAFLSAPDSDFVKAEVLLGASDDLPPPLPPGVAKPGSPANTPIMPAQALQTPPKFIKPLPLFSPIPSDRDVMVELHDVIDLAEIAEKKTSSPTPFRE